MKINTQLSIIFFYLCFLHFGKEITAQNNLQNFNYNWKFTETDSPDYRLTTYNTKDWRTLDLPHDWSIEHDFDKKLEGATAFMPGGIGWYSKSFPTVINENQKCYIIFDGVYNNAAFWINGMKFGEHPYGYAPIYYDITKYLSPEGKENRISVRVDHSRYADSRWYTGSGIYRNVQLLIVDKLHIPVWGTYITTPEVSKEKATIEIQIELKNDYKTQKSGSLISDIFDANGLKKGTASTSFTLKDNENSVFKQQIQISNPSLWSVDQPQLYKVKTRVVADNKTVEERTSSLGIRSIRFDKDKGFFLNEKNMKIKGVCLHHDAGLVGTAVPKDVWRRRLLLLKDMGCNAIRTSHNPVSDEFLDLCDELGFLVQHEFYDEWDLPKDKRYNMQDKEVDYITRGQSENFQLWAETDLKNTMLSSRNHPSIFQWSIGNEIEWTYPGNREATGIFKGTDIDGKMDWTLWRGNVPPNNPEQVREFWKNYPKQTFSIGETARKLANWTRELDSTRPVTANLILPTSSFETGYADVLDVVGLSYKEDKYDYFHKNYPNKVIMGTENVPRWYEWKAALDRDFISGIFLWTGVDYMGECRPSDWPVKVTPQGPLDVAAFPRGSFYHFKSMWRDDVAVLAMYSQTAKKSTYKKEESGQVVEKKKDNWKLAPRAWQDVNPYWNYKDGEETIVEVYSNCEVVELFQNGKSLGKQYLKDQEDHIYKWSATYKKGELVAKGIYGKQKATASLQTAGNAMSIRLTPDRSKLQANRTDVLHVIAQLIDKNGLEVKNEDNEISFEITGDYKLLGTDCGDTSKITNFKQQTVQTAFGQCLLAIQATDKQSSVTIIAKSKDGKLLSNKVIVAIDAIANDTEP